MKVVVVVQARLNSSRLPGKVMLPLAGEPMLVRQLERLEACEQAHEVCVATTATQHDEPIRELGRRRGVRVVSGHEADLLDRLYRAGLATSADAVVQVASDSPLIDPEVVDQVIRSWRRRSAELDLSTNLMPPTFPDGNGAELIPMDVLRTACAEARRPSEREHVSLFIRSNPERFRIENVRCQDGFDRSQGYRFRVGYAEDYTFVRAIFEALWSERTPIFGLADIFRLLAERPDLRRINARYCNKPSLASTAPDRRSLPLQELRAADAE
jgi:spore coat polysaccharide biosynthesis protein SpsF